MPSYYISAKPVYIATCRLLLCLFVENVTQF